MEKMQGVNGIYVVQNKIQARAFVHPVVNLRATDKLVSKLSSWTNISFSGMAFLYAFILSVSSLTRRDVSAVQSPGSFSCSTKGKSSYALRKHYMVLL
jgi:hypothetical protein